MENRAEAMLAWWGIVHAGAVAVPVNSAYKGSYLRHQLSDSGSRALLVEADFVERAVEVLPDLPELVDPRGRGRRRHDFDAGPAALRWDDVMATGGSWQRPDVRPERLATFVYTGGTTGLSKGCMLTHNYHGALAQQIGYCWERPADDVVWTPLPMFHFNALVTAVVGTLVYGGRGAIYRRFSVSNFWPEMNRTGATMISTLGTMAYLLAHDVDRPEMPKSGAPEANTSLRLMGAAPLPPEVDDVIREPLRHRHLQRRVRRHRGEPGLVAAAGSAQPARAAPASSTPSTSTSASSTTTTTSSPAAPRARSCVRPKRRTSCSRATGDGPRSTRRDQPQLVVPHRRHRARSTRTTTCTSSTARPTTCAAAARTSPASRSSAILMGHGALADVAVHAVPSDVTEDDLKVTATLKHGAPLTEAELFLWCVDQLPYFALPRYIEFREELPRSPVGRVLKRELRAEGATPTTWDLEKSGHHVREAVTRSEMADPPGPVLTRGVAGPARPGSRRGRRRTRR